MGWLWAVRSPRPAVSTLLESQADKVPWYRVVCLTGVDYFSTLAYQSGIAFLAAQFLSPIATLILVLFTLFGALPVYRRVAEESPHGEGSISMFGEVMSWWWAKLSVLILLGFMGTDFIVTITLSSADTAVHMTENPLFPKVLQHHDLAVTLVLISVLALLFLRGFHEAIGLSVVLVVVYLALNFTVAVRCVYEVFRHPEVVGSWTSALFTSHGSVMTMIALSALAFPKLALGLSGFAGASAMAGIINIIPRYLPRYGMSPSWVNAIRPLVLFNTAIAFVVTIWFNASVDAQAGAYATGVLFLMTAAAFTVTLSAWRRRQRRAAAGFLLIFLIFSYTTIDNIIERPDGMRIAAFFIAMTVIASLASRFWRTTELRIEQLPRARTG